MRFATQSCSHMLVRRGRRALFTIVIVLLYTFIVWIILYRKSSYQIYLQYRLLTSLDSSSIAQEHETHMGKYEDMAVLKDILFSLPSNSRLNPQTNNSNTIIDTTESTVSNNKRTLRIALLSNWVSQDTNSAVLPSLYEPHMISKACYCDMWGYDCIFNTSWSFREQRSAENIRSRQPCWLEFGHWHRIPQIHDLMHQNNPLYDWIWWTDTDVAIQKTDLSIEAMLDEMSHAGLKNVHVVLPETFNTSPFHFGTFSLLIRNSHFGRAVIQEWFRAAMGLCPQGNFHHLTCGRYQFLYSDQPAFWYALPMAYSNFFRPDVPFEVRCDNQTGLIHKSHGNFQRDMGHFFKSVGLAKNADLSSLPKDQPIIWSAFKDFGSAGIGMKPTSGNLETPALKNIFALHRKQQLPANVLKTVDTCQIQRGCYAFSQTGKFLWGCHNQSFISE